MPGRSRGSRFLSVARAGKVFSAVEPPLKTRLAIGLIQSIVGVEFLVRDGIHANAHGLSQLQLAAVHLFQA